MNHKNIVEVPGRHKEKRFLQEHEHKQFAYYIVFFVHIGRAEWGGVQNSVLNI